MSILYSVTNMAICIPTKLRLRRLRKLMLSIVSERTAFNPTLWRGGMSQHCGPVSYVVQKLFGGAIVGGKIGNESHLWNRLEDGREFDLTSDQYGGNGIDPIIKGRQLRGRKTINSRYIEFEQMLNETIFRT